MEGWKDQAPRKRPYISVTPHKLPEDDGALCNDMHEKLEL